ncbi:MAG: hypothetical protein MMC33_006190 [Icmadophila ericetorum]|nr:hypothetical protein [Icmadophila ericetorum]
MSFEQLMPVFLSEHVSHEKPSFPFKFVGGFGLPTRTIGLMLSLQGVYSMTAQIFLFPFVVSRFGSLNTFRFVVVSWPLLYLIVPYMVLLPERLQMPGLFFCFLWKITAQVLAYPSNAILLANSAPSNLVLGAINGAAASTASLCRAFGPTISGVIHSWGVGMGYSGLAWWAGGLICILGAIESLWMEDAPASGRMDIPSIEDEEAITDELFLDPQLVEEAIMSAAKRSDNVLVSSKPNGQAGSAHKRFELDG